MMLMTDLKRPEFPRRAAGWMRAGAVLAAGALAAFARPAAAQDDVLAREAVVAGSEAEAYLRTLQVAGQLPSHPWSLRGFAPREMARLHPDSAHPWTSRTEERRPFARVSGGLLRPSARAAYNTGFAYGYNDGPVWRGRGVTVEAHAGATARVGPLSLRVEPVVFWAENREFALMPNGRTGEQVYADGRSPRNIDLPQRFGDEAYARVDPGESTLRLDVAGFALGASTAAQQWGPSRELPLILGNNAGGFAHVFAGTSSPWNTPIGRVHGRVLWGSVSQSDYSPMQGPGSRRFATGMVAVWMPRGLNGLEIGGSRFFHLAWPEDGLSSGYFTKIFEGITKASVDSSGVGTDGRSSPDNQLASVFARWVFPRAGLEVYGEFAREDHNYDLLDFALEPDHQAGYTLGAARAWRPSPTRLASVRIEVQSTEPSTLARVRRQPAFYRHDNALQGHTSRGQVLGSPFGYGGGGSIVAADLYHPRGRWTAQWVRTRMGGTLAADSADVMHTLSAEGVFFRGPVDLVGGVAWSANLNRYNGGDAHNLNAQFGVRVGLGPGRARPVRVDTFPADR